MSGAVGSSPSLTRSRSFESRRWRRWLSCSIWTARARRNFQRDSLTLTAYRTAIPGYRPGEWLLRRALEDEVRLALARQRRTHERKREDADVLRHWQQHRRMLQLI